MSHALQHKVGLTCTRVEVNRAGGGCTGGGGQGSGGLCWSRNVLSESVVLIRTHCKNHDEQISVLYKLLQLTEGLNFRLLHRMKPISKRILFHVISLP